MLSILTYPPIANSLDSPRVSAVFGMASSLDGQRPAARGCRLPFDALTIFDVAHYELVRLGTAALPPLSTIKKGNRPPANCLGSIPFSLSYPGVSYLISEM